MTDRQTMLRQIDAWLVSARCDSERVVDAIISIEFLESLRQELQRGAAEAGTWQQMSTPLPAQHNQLVWIVFACDWNPYTRVAAQWSNGEWLDCNDEPIDMSDMTHWMALDPLPAPPPASGTET